jgi:hypothetical protein
MRPRVAARRRRLGWLAIGAVVLLLWASFPVLLGQSTPGTAQSGATALGATVSLSPGTVLGSDRLSVGTVLQPPFLPAADPDVASMWRPLGMHLVRMSEFDWDSAQTWDAASATPQFQWTTFSSLLGTVRALGAVEMVSLPVGTWGDGNYLPAGMPLDRSLVVRGWGGSTGYFPTVSAYDAYVSAFARYAAAESGAVAYYTIGNEVPTFSSAVLVKYTALFNAAAAIIHRYQPHALVGFDNSIAKADFAYFLNNSHGLGFLSFHYYPAYGLCGSWSSYCEPTGSNGYWTDAQLMAPSSGLTGQPFVPPKTAQALWMRYRGQTLPIVDSETNLNSATPYGSDPRIQTDFGAAWLAHVLRQGALQNLNDLLYFQDASFDTTTKTAPWGGFGFGFAKESDARDVDWKLAPYWTIRTWDRDFGFPTPILGVTSSLSTLESFAVRNGTGANVWLVNDAPDSVDFSVRVPSWTGVSASLTWLDARTYSESTSTANHTTWLSRDGLGSASIAAGHPISGSLRGFGFAVVRLVPTASAAGAGAPLVRALAQPLGARLIRLPFTPVGRVASASRPGP